MDTPNARKTCSTPAEFGQAFRQEREALGLTQSDVANAARCRRQTIGDLEEGKNVGMLTMFRALGAIGKRLAIHADRPDAADIARMLEDEE
jgi:transcriptional regulator with XRE-family HTH domain